MDCVQEEPRVVVAIATENKEAFEHEHAWDKKVEAMPLGVITEVKHWLACASLFGIPDKAENIVRYLCYRHFYTTETSVMTTELMELHKYFNNLE